MSCITEGSTGYPGANANIPFENGFLSEILLQNGYNTYAIGKWHLTPADQMSAAGPYDRWPLGRGFERYYGYLGGDTNQYYPELVSNNQTVEPEKSPEEGYILIEDLTDKAISFIADSKQVAPNKPFFLYFCPGAGHAPHHVPKEWADKYKGKFDDGWDAYRAKTFARQKELGIIPKDAELSRHDPDVQDWNTLSADEKKLYSRMMEVFAGFLTQNDYHYGRLFDFLKTIGQWENTLIMFISDNGASAEGGPNGSVNENKFFNNVPDSLEQNLKLIDELGGPTTYNHYAWGWAFAGNTPFRRWKRETYRGGVSDPFIVHWPQGIKAKGELRTQYAHAIDMVPTVLEALCIEGPTSIKGVAQSPIQGLSFAGALDDAKAPTKHITQYFEMMGHRSIYHDGWRAVCPWPGPSFKEAGMGFGIPIKYDELTELDAKNWELYHLETDYAENHDIAAENRAKLIEMVGTWYVEAGKYNVLPIDSRGPARALDERPQIAVARESCTYYPNTQVVPINSCPQTAEPAIQHHRGCRHPEGWRGRRAPVLWECPRGVSFYVQNAKLHYAYNYVDSQYFDIESTAPVPEGRHQLRFEFEVTGKPDIMKGKGAPGTGRLYVDGKLAGQGDLPLTIPILMGLGVGILCGANTGSPVCDKYDPPFTFTGTIYSATVDVSGETIKEDPDHAFKVMMARQ